MRKRCVLLLVPLLCAACESNPAEPSPPTPLIPSVAGNYAGTLSFSDSASLSRNNIGNAKRLDGQHRASAVERTTEHSVPHGHPVRGDDDRQDRFVGNEVRNVFIRAPVLYHYGATGGFVERDLRISVARSIAIDSDTQRRRASGGRVLRSPPHHQPHEAIVQARG